MEFIQIGTIGFRDGSGKVVNSKPLNAKQTKILKQARQRLLKSACEMIISDLKNQS